MTENKIDHPLTESVLNRIVERIQANPVELAVRRLTDWSMRRYDYPTHSAMAADVLAVCKELTGRDA